MMDRVDWHSHEQAVQVVIGADVLDGTLGIPEQAGGGVLFTHGSGHGRQSPRNHHVARQLQAAGRATLLLDLRLLAERLVGGAAGHSPPAARPLR